MLGYVVARATELIGRRLRPRRPGVAGCHHEGVTAYLHASLEDLLRSERGSAHGGMGDSAVLVHWLQRGRPLGGDCGGALAVWSQRCCCVLGLQSGLTAVASFPAIGEWLLC
ncbi:hypothetical protein ZEAMMB73_Zm00001d010464 [Zea mays]|uniref:Uncharacterized protein n=1 Tax=Zea mays TaxID=4577 RepID=A0A1D6FR62_MAIZE|nr:hypothetical protein ZEAMMB73_Zm00001d010464 [Zea mays]